MYLREPSLTWVNSSGIGLNSIKETKRRKCMLYITIIIRSNKCNKNRDRYFLKFKNYKWKWLFSSHEIGMIMIISKELKDSTNKLRREKIC